VKIHGNVFIGEEVYIENNFPHAVEIHEDVVITVRTTIMAHFRGSGKVVIEKKAWIGPNCFVGASSGQQLTIGEGAVLGASSVVTKDVPPYTMVVGMQAKPFAKVTVPFTLEKSYEEISAGLIRIEDKD
jgi:acetyltransferase-like isoleucine patch superfamily enzyme